MGIVLVASAVFGVCLLILCIIKKRVAKKYLKQNPQFDIYRNKKLDLATEMLAILAGSLFGSAFLILSLSNLIEEDNLRKEKTAIIENYIINQDEACLAEATKEYNQKVDEYVDRNRSFWYNCFYFLVTDDERDVLKIVEQKGT